MLAAKSGFIEGIRLGHSVSRAIGTNLYLSNSSAKFGSTSLFGSTTLNTLIKVTPFSDFAFGTGDFTIEFWFNPATVTIGQTLFGLRPPSTNGLYPCVYMNTNGILSYYVLTADKIVSPINGIVANTWQSCSVVRKTGQTKMYINGTQTGSTYADTNNYSAGGCTIAANDFLMNGGYQLRGYMDELRVSNIARYSGNYTPATEPFIDDANTLLLLHFEGANNSFVFVDDNT